MLSAWQALYDQQKTETFIWPKGLGDDFIQAVAATEGTKDELELPLLERFKDRVQNAPAARAAIVDSEPPTIAGAVPPANPIPVERHVVWQSLNEIQQAFEWDRNPTTQIVKQAQEELWVYQAICKEVIAEVNSGSHGYHDAPINEIVALDIAYLANDGLPGHGKVMPMPSMGLSTPVSNGDAASIAPAGPDPTLAKPEYRSRLKGDLTQELPAWRRRRCGREPRRDLEEFSLCE